MAASGFLPRAQLQQLFDVLHQQGFACVGPKQADNAIVYAEIQGVDDLPKGLEVDQSPGQFSMQQQEHDRHFSWANTAQAIKPLSFTSREVLWQCEKDAQGNLHFKQHMPPSRAIAIIGARACDLAALRLQEQHFLNPYAEDPWFKQRIGNLFIVAVHCSHAAATCFCHNTGDGPRASRDFDIAMHELDQGFILEAGSYSGEKILRKLALDKITAQHSKLAEEQINTTISRQTRTLPAEVKDILLQRLEHPHWEKVGERCLSCGNCTAVCPTCFCHQQHDEFSMANNTGSHYREWSSCFTHNHGYISGHSLRPTTARRYRQWLTHKFANWYEQYGRSGCVGCGRCITWCPVGIDVTVELKALCESET
jgi:ferredoxin